MSARWMSLLGAVALVAALAGCGSTTAVQSASPTAATPLPAPSSSAAQPTADPSPENVIIDCDLVLHDDHAAGLVPALKPIPDFAPAPGTLGATMAAQGGRACGWGADSTASLEVVVAIPTPAGLKAAESAAAASGQVSEATEADSAYFQVVGGIGQAQIFMGSYWIEVSSPGFSSPETADDVYSVVIHDFRTAGG